MKNQHIDLFTTHLKRLSAILDKVENHCGGDNEVLKTRLANDMFPMGVQVEIAVNMALRACCPIAKVKVVMYANETNTFSNLKKIIGKTVDCLHDLDNLDQDFDVTVNDKAGPAQVALLANNYLVRFAYPNFYFHMTMVYAIARSIGVPLTKGDFDGIHQYPPGFSFANERA